MFYCNQYSKEAKTGDLCLYNCTPEAVKWILDNLYCGKMSFQYVHVALSVYSFAQMYQILGVVELTKEVGLFNCISVFSFGECG